MKNVACDYKSVDDNIQYLNKCGAKHHLVMYTRITNYTQGLKFRRRDDSYLGRFITIMKEQSLK